MAAGQAATQNSPDPLLMWDWLLGQAARQVSGVVLETYYLARGQKATQLVVSR
jgi:hypothetical protein